MHRFRFSLRMWIVVTLILPCFLVSWIVSERRSAQRDDVTISIIRECDGIVPHLETARPMWMRVLLGDDSASNVTYLIVSSKRFGDNELERVAQLPMIESLSLAGTSITDKGIAHLAQHTQLRVLDIRSTSVGDEGVRALAFTRRLEVLNISATKIADTAFIDDDGWPVLSSLTCDRVRLSALCVERICTSLRLELLSL